LKTENYRKVQLFEIFETGKKRLRSAGGPPAIAGQRPALPVHSCGYLPHVEGAEYQVITYRLADSLPRDVVKCFANEIHKKQQRREQIENYVDAGYGKCWLARHDIAQLVITNWQYFNGERYDLIAYVVMPNHVHVLIRVYDGVRLSDIVHSWKSFTAKAIVNSLKDAGESPALPIWQPEYWDRYIRDQAHFENAVDYIHQNPVKAGLVSFAEKWPWSSAAMFSLAGGTARSESLERGTACP
jgi:REP element-mobilizing transposase RayT